VILLSRHERLSELFGNLVRNAIKYNKEGGSVTVTLNREKLEVEDTGIGISEENLGKVFSRFFTVDKSHNGKNGGFGLGLAIVRKLCTRAGWKLSVESRLGEGTTFKIRFFPPKIL
jgi:two-component system phosphate regulon sensor histidine kinase PhoR